MENHRRKALASLTASMQGLVSNDTAAIVEALNGQTHALLERNELDRISLKAALAADEAITNDTAFEAARVLNDDELAMVNNSAEGD